ncbi:ATP-binding cassette domain-containing protein [Thauera humireducens]|uniref:ATP-binding cassette domain-containing protein n=1 Tax=Thauera humireducens TaxID=1134435 RepID=UPI0031203177
MGIIDSNEVRALAAPTGAATNRSTGVRIGLQGLCKHYGDRRVLQPLDLDIPAGQFVALVGRSGCGKSTLLRLLAGLEPPTAGTIAIDGRPLRETHDAIRIMFQDARSAAVEDRRRQRRPRPARLGTRTTCRGPDRLGRRRPERPRR